MIVIVSQQQFIRIAPDCGRIAAMQELEESHAG
jgi:hypothetical protein